jgi:hypothetical protein
MTAAHTVPAKFKSKEFIDRLTASARKSKSLMPTDDELKTVDKPTKALFERLSVFLEEILSTTEWTDANLLSLARDAAWAHTSVGLSLRPANRPVGAPGWGSSSVCEDVYDQCMQDHGCTHSIVCVCCLPCVVEYTGCMKKIIFKVGGAGGVTPVTTTGGEAGQHPAQ